MKGVCLRYASCDTEADDMLQEAFIRIFQHLDDYTERGPLGAWIRRITVNTALEFCRKNQSIRLQLTKLAEMQSSPFTQDNAIEQLQAKELLFKIQQLPPGFRTVFNLYAVEGYTHREIGELLGISEGTSKSQYSRARVMLRAMIDQETIQEQQYGNYARS